QAARDALCRAVQLPGILGLSARPDPVWRQGVRQRLRPRRSLGRWFIGKRLYRGHPLLWTGLGAAAALLIVLAIGRGSAPLSTPISSPAPVVESDAGAQPAAPSLEEVSAWAKLPKNEQFKKAGDRLRVAKRDEVKPRNVGVPPPRQ